MTDGWRGRGQIVKGLVSMPREESSPGDLTLFAMLHFLAGVEYTGAHYILL